MTKKMFSYGLWTCHALQTFTKPQRGIKKSFLAILSLFSKRCHSLFKNVALGFDVENVAHEPENIKYLFVGRVLLCKCFQVAIADPTWLH